MVNATGFIVVGLIILLGLIITMVVIIYCFEKHKWRNIHKENGVEANTEPTSPGENVDTYDTLNYQEMTTTVTPYDDTVVEINNDHNEAMKNYSMKQDRQYEGLAGHYMNSIIGSGKPYEMLKVQSARHIAQGEGRKCVPAGLSFL